MRIDILCVGKLKESYFKAAEKEYIKRLSMCKIDITEVPDEPIPHNASEKEKEDVLQKEGKNLLAKINKDSFCIVLDVKGKDMDSTAFVDTVKSLMVSGRSRLAIVIGGSLGLSQEVKDRADLLLSLSSMTFTHNMTRIILLEQLYRAFSIIGNRTYHK